MKINQIAKKAGVSPRSLRHYEKKGLIAVSRQENNYREYDDSILEAINKIQLYLHLGLTTDQIKDILHCPDELTYDKKEDEYCEALLRIYETNLEAVNRQRKALDDAKVRLEKQISLMRENLDHRDPQEDEQ